MANRVGTKGQVVIEKDIRDQLGIQPGWTAIQWAVDGHVEIHFVAPPQKRSLLGALAKYANNAPAMTDGEWRQARIAAWASGWAEKLPEDGGHGGSRTPPGESR